MIVKGSGLLVGSPDDPEGEMVLAVLDDQDVILSVAGKAEGRGLEGDGEIGLVHDLAAFGIPEEERTPGDGDQVAPASEKGAAKHFAFPFFAGFGSSGSEILLEMSATPPMENCGAVK